MDNLRRVTNEGKTCYRHDDRRAGVSCQRCGRPVCPDCMHQASVGFHCPECTKTNKQKVYTARTLPGLSDQPIITKVLIGINAVAFLAVLATGGDIGGVGSSLTDQGTVFAAWLGSDGEVVGVATGEWWRIITSGFLHGGLIHLGMNMLFLWILGPQLERALGRWNYLAVYIAGLVGGSLGALIFDPFVPTLGASGAIYGLLGAALVLQRSSGINVWQSGILGLLLINVMITFAIPQISIGGHLGGLVGGLLASFAVVEISQRSKSRVLPAVVVLGITAVLFGASLWVADYSYTNLQPLIDLPI
jgi:membrane associated rhomboid family serine protease